MARDYYQWWEVTPEYIEIKFVDTLDTSTLVNANIVLYDDQATPQVVADPFKTISTATDFSSISRILNLWWDTFPVTGTYTLEFNNLKDFLGNPIDTFSFTFEWISDYATPNTNLQPTREPVEVEDYSIKTPGWSIIDSSSITEDATPLSGQVSIIDLAPGVSTHHFVSAYENEGKIDVLFDNPIASNYVSPYYFVLNYKEIKQGISTWKSLPTLVLANLDSTMVTIYLPAKEGLDMATPSYIYSNDLTDAEIAGYTFFVPQTKYRLVVSTEVGL